MASPDRTIIANVPRLDRSMEANGLDAIAVRTGVNFTYLSGIALPGTLARHLDIASTVRGFMLVWPRKGKSIIILDSFAENVVVRDSWVDTTVVYKAYANRFTRALRMFSRTSGWRVHAWGLKRMA